MAEDSGRVTGSREPSPSSSTAGLGPSGFDPARRRLPLTPALLSKRLGEMATFLAVGEPFNPVVAERITREASAMIAAMAAALEPFARLARPKSDEPGAYTPLQCIDTLYGGTGELKLSSLVGSTDSYETLWALDFERAAIATEAQRADDAEGGSAGTARARAEGIAQTQEGTNHE